MDVARMAVLVAVTGVMAVACGGGLRSGPPGSSGGGRATGGRHGPSGEGQAPDLTVGDDVLASVLAWGDDQFAPPPTQFRQIEIASASLPPEAFQRTDDGYRVRLPSGAPVVTPTVYEDLVVVSGGFRSRDMYAFHAREPRVAWAIQLGDDGPSNAACEDRVCVFNTESCTIFAVEARTGRLLWSWYLGDPLMSAPSIANGLVFAAYPAHGGAGSAEGEARPRPDGPTHVLAAFDLHEGTLRWARWIDGDVISAPVAIYGAVYAATLGGTLYKIDQRSGEVLQARRALATTAPAYIDGALYFARRTEQMVQEEGGRVRRRALESVVGTQKPGGPGEETEPRAADYLDYEFQDDTVYGEMSQQNDAANGISAPNADMSRALIGRGTVHGLQEYQGSWVLGVGDANYAAMGDSLLCFDRLSGRERWSTRLPGDLAQLGGALAAPPASAGNRIIVATTAGQLMIVDPESGRVNRRIDVGAPMRTQPAVHDGWIYAGTADGHFVARNTGDRSLSGWPTWAANPARTGAPD